MADPSGLGKVDWTRAMPQEKFCLKIVRPATGGVRKTSVVFVKGQIDLVLIPVSQLRLASFAMWLGLHKRPGKLQTALNEIHVSVRSGYRFIKGEQKWRGFYSRISTEMPGVRLTNGEAVSVADVFLCEMLWVLQKIERGELLAAQRSLHRSLADANFLLLRELRLRKNEPLPSFGLARRVEILLKPTELKWISVDSHLNREELRRATWQMLDGLKAMMHQIVPEWVVPTALEDVLSRLS